MANTDLTRTTGTPTNTDKFTFSVWIKRANISNANQTILGTYTDGNNRSEFGFVTSDLLRWEFVESGSNVATFETNRLFRDTNSWYHFVLAYDSSQASSSDRMKLYINGVQETSFASTNYPAQNANSRLNTSGKTIRIGSRGDGNQPFDGCMSHVHFIDGTAYAASDFGSTDATTGEWKINTSPNVTYGNNGFFILKNGNSVTDESPNTNNFTVNGGTLTKTEDCPSDVFATLNPLHYSLNTSRAFSNGNTYVALGGTARVPEVSTIGMTSGKFYAEMKDISGSGGGSIMGITGQMRRASVVDFLGSKIYDYAYYSASGDKINDGNETSFGNSYTDGDIIGVAVDLDNLKIYFSKNGTWQNSGDPTSGSTGTGAAFTLAAPSSTIDGAYFFACSDDNQYAERRMAWNFGNGYFQTTAVSSAGTNASNIGIFEYDVPTGYTALSTKGLNE
jgi:hypothetical protein